MNAADTLARARSAVGKQIAYRLGKGGEDPRTALPCDADKRCDCSGFALWAIGVSRTVRVAHRWRDRFPPIDGQPFGIDTTRIFADATGDRKAFRIVELPEPGDLLVYGDRHGHEGHIGIISSTEQGIPVMVIHCSAGNFRTTGDAIQETTLQPFWETRGAIYARPVDYVAGPPVGAGGEA